MKNPKLELEFSVEFFLFDKPFKTKIMAENESQVTQKLNDLILSRVKVSSIDLLDEELSLIGNVLENFNSFLDSYKKFKEGTNQVKV
jgi:hypothetical protein